MRPTFDDRDREILDARVALLARNPINVGDFVKFRSGIVRRLVSDAQLLAAAIKRLLDNFPEPIRREALDEVLGARCRKCLDPDGNWCCYDTRDT